VRKVAVLLFWFALSSCGTYSLNLCLKGEKVENPSILGKESKPYLEKGFKEGYFCYGYSLLLEGKPKEAIPFLIKAYRKGFKKASYYIGKAYLEFGNKKKAAYWYLKAIEDGFVNNDYFKTTTYISKGELDKLYQLGKKFPVLYLYLGDYFFRNEFYDAALYYYHLAIRYGFKRAKLMAGLSLHRLGNKKEALNTLYSLYKEGDKKGAEAIALLIERDADLLGGCTVLNAKTPEDFVKKRAEVFKEKKELYTLSAKFYRLASDEKNSFRVLRKAEFYSPSKKRKEFFPSGLKVDSLSYGELRELCLRGEEWAELLLAKKRGKDFLKAAKEFYRAFGFKVKQ